MTMQADRAGEVSDVDLIVRAREADQAAVAALFERHHPAALRLARMLTDPVTAEDVASEAFGKVMRALREGKGPTEAFRPYLLTAVRNVHVDHVRADRRYVWDDEPESPEAAPPASVSVEAREEAALVARAFSTLPERWQSVLWHTVVENDDHVTIGRLLGIKANAVAALAFRARDGLREAYLTAHLGELRPACRPTRGSLAAYARGTLRARRRSAVEHHLEECPECTAAVAELRRMGRGTALLLGPGVLGAAGAAYVASAWRGAGVDPADVELSSGPRRGPRHAAVAVAAVSVLALGAAAVQAVPEADTPGVTASQGRAPATTGPAPDGDSGAGTDAPSTGAETGDPRPPRPSGSTPSRRPTPGDEADPGSDGSSPTPDSVTPPPTPTPTPTPRPTPSPTETPSASPTSRPTPETSAPEPTEPAPAILRDKDLWLEAPMTEDLVDFRHVEVRVGTGGLASVQVVLRFQGITSWTLHEGPSWAVATCREADGAVSCEVSSARGPLGLDVVAPDGFVVDAVVSAPGNNDPRPENNRLSFRG
ncbi:sigma-70 family RNA polymerase sigma factor [Nocardioides sp. SYSU D00065]|uniref:sigma-70 family RNA polymerase sigma factor n=1 Tax=Nocardioides sp. SYSU D00065 TaxID=2817378 RepID=UPI001B344CF5|nr:sigma-70 family RNA polymerase sigma factor [Nocardioides sp. SYSU D00065]